MHHTLAVTVTPNPSLDLLFETERLVWDDANRIPDPRRRPGGQGINVARAIRQLGGNALAVALLAGRTGDEILAALQQEGVAIRTVPAAGETRTFVAVREQAAGRSMLLNARGPARTTADGESLLRAIGDELRDRTPDWIACCGSLPPGFPDDFYHVVATHARAAGARVCVDCDGAALRYAATLCDLLVPNQHEAARLTGRTIECVDDAIAALDDLPAPLSIITLGQDGAVMRHDAATWHARPPQVPASSTVGAGDCFLAGLLMGLHRGLAPADALRSATAAATAALLSKGDELVSATTVHELTGAVALARVT